MRGVRLSPQLDPTNEQNCLSYHVYYTDGRLRYRRQFPPPPAAYATDGRLRYRRPIALLSLESRPKRCMLSRVQNHLSYMSCMSYRRLFTLPTADCAIHPGESFEGVHVIVRVVRIAPQIDPSNEQDRLPYISYIPYRRSFTLPTTVLRYRRSIALLTLESRPRGCMLSCALYG